MKASARAAFAAAAARRAGEVVALTRRLTAIASPNPPGDVRDLAAVAAEMQRALAPAAETSLHASDPALPIIRHVHQAAQEVLHEPVAVNMRVGGSDARWFRMAGLPTVVYGPTPHNMGGADERVSVAELEAIAQIHALAGFDFLSAEDAA